MYISTKIQIGNPPWYIRATYPLCRIERPNFAGIDDNVSIKDRIFLRSTSADLE